MFAFLSSRQLLFITHRNRRTQFQLGLLQKTAFFSIKSFSSLGLSEPKQQNESQRHSFTVSYLINSCGFSPKSALLASQKVHFENPDKPDSVLNLLKHNGFNDTHITKLIRQFPRFLLLDPKNTLLPKIEFFRSIGISTSDLPRILSTSPDLLKRSLKNHLIPCYDILKSLLVENEKVIKTLRRSHWSLQYIPISIVPNVELLREVGVPQSNISFLVTTCPFVASTQPSKLVKAIQEVKEMGIDPSKIVFVQAIVVVLTLKKPMWEYKFEIFKRWGWSKEDTLLAFKKDPNFMRLSEKNITKTMNFLVNKLGRPSADIARNPVVLHLSLEKRIIPRCSVLQILVANDLVKDGLSFSSFLLVNEKSFLKKYVSKFQDIAPQLLSLYQNKMDLPDVEIQFEKALGNEIDFKTSSICIGEATFGLLLESGDVFLWITFERKAIGLLNPVGYTEARKETKVDRVPFDYLSYANGSNDTHITKPIKINPRFLLSDPKKTLLPKIEFFLSIGISSSDLPRTLTLIPDLLQRSLNNVLIPCYNFLKSLLVEKEKVITTLKRSR
ncbi:hypothetical protein SO802_033538 [Lithocarpus litseifolius]|uniref:mTERF protein n=1 Tax=Lithocarpus litseifolius TaxID=425828 RepID=A0AAW2BEZ8_9ROSI